MSTSRSVKRANWLRERINIGRPAHLRHTNALTVLRLLREAGSCSRADLVRASGLSAPTVTNVVVDLLAADLIKALGEGESSGGRPPDIISFKAERGCLIAVQIEAGQLKFLLSDLIGTELESSELPLENKKTTPEAICKLIGAETRRLLKKYKKSREQLLAMVIAVPAIARVDDGVVVSITTLEDWRNVPLRSMLYKVVDCLVVVENDTNLSAMGERHRGAALGQDTFVLINVGNNVSAGIVLDGRIHHGAQWSAGEIAYLRLPQISRSVPTLHQFGELEGVLTGKAIVEGYFSPGTRPKRASDQPRRDLDVSCVLDLAMKNDKHASEVVEVRAAILSDIVINLALILNPGLILLAGEVGSHPAMLRSVQQELGRSEFAVPKISAAKLGDSAALWGAIAAALEELPLLLLPQP